MTDLLPIFLDLADRTVVLVGAGRVAATKLQQLLAAGARVHVIAPELCDEIAAMVRSPERLALRIPEKAALEISQRAFVPQDLDGAWLVVAAATPDVNRQVADAAEARRVFVNAVDDPANASAFFGGVIRRDGVTLAISTSGDAPALTALLREGLDALLPRDLGAWMTRARAERGVWRRDGVPMDERKPRLLRALNDLYEATAEFAEHADKSSSAGSARSAVASDPKVPWLSGPEDSWL